MRRPGPVAALAVLAAVALAAAAVLAVLLVARTGAASAGPAGSAGPVGSAASQVPSDTSLEAGFSRDMQAHHRQAVTMSLLVLERTDDPQVRSLATDIMLTQQQQAGQMYAWLDLWGLPQTGSEPVMAWMGHSVDGVAGMPGMASAEELQRLQEAEGTDAERVFLQLMIPHHEAGVEMADVALAGTDDPVVVRLAGAVSASQTSELTALRTLLEARGGPLAA